MYPLENRYSFQERKTVLQFATRSFRMPFLSYWIAEHPRHQALSNVNEKIAEFVNLHRNIALSRESMLLHFSQYSLSSSILSATFHLS